MKRTVALAILVLVLPTWAWMLLSRGDPLVLFQRPISAAILALAVVALLVVVSPAIRSRRDEAFQES
jgi:TctA family transporter